MELNENERQHLIEEIKSINSFANMSVETDDDRIIVTGDLFPSAFMQSLNEILGNKYVYIIKPDNNNNCCLRIFSKIKR